VLFHDSNHNFLPQDGSATLHYDCFDAAHFSALLHEVNWREETLTIFGKPRLVPRLIAFYGDRAYGYSGAQHEAQDMPPVLTSIQEIVERVADSRFNSVLCNRYRGGSDSMGWHRDNEAQLDQTCIASVSFGASRRFKMRHREEGTVIDFELPSGSILLMHDCQEMWEHSLPKTKKQVGERINLTYRKVIA
jgi:alkylated DNA repair dioxygenase AlkB